MGEAGAQRGVPRLVVCDMEEWIPLICAVAVPPALDGGEYGVFSFVHPHAPPVCLIPLIHWSGMDAGVAVWVADGMRAGRRTENDEESEFLHWKHPHAAPKFVLGSCPAANAARACAARYVAKQDDDCTFRLESVMCVPNVWEWA